jgi:multidrug efflux pump subunit AcrB
LIPSSDLKTINSMIGVPIGFTLAFVPSDNIGPMDTEIQIALNEKHRPTQEYVTKIREDLNKSFPGSTLYFMPADLMNEVLNFGLSAMIDVQIEAKQVEDALKLATTLKSKMILIPGAMDSHITQVFDYPTLRVTVDRVRASRLGLSQKDVASSMLISLSSSSLYAPSFYLNPDNNVSYFVVAKTPLAKIINIDDLLRTPMTATSGIDANAPGSLGDGSTVSATTASAQQELSAPTEILGNLATINTGTSIDEVDHYNIQRVVDVTAGVENRDLGSVVSEIQKVIKSLGQLPADVKVNIRGQSEVMRTAFGRLGLGLIVAIILVYLLMVILFQSWLDPFIILVSVPGAMIGVLWSLALTGTSINVVSLMGSIMAVGIAVSNSILMVSFANDLRTKKNLDAHGAAIEAGKTRLRPVIMTALAMVLGMLPMAIGLGEAGRQNAPLGRAVIGGLLIATLTTLFIVPIAYSILRKKTPQKMFIRQEVQKDEDAFEKEREKLERPSSKQEVSHA